LAFELRGVAVPGDGAYESDEETTPEAGAPLRVPDCSVAFTERSQHLNRQRSKPAFPVGPLFALYQPGHLTLRAAPPASPTADSSPSSTLALHPPPKPFQ